jgi:hypothetical protein
MTILSAMAGKPKRKEILQREGGGPRSSRYRSRSSSGGTVRKRQISHAVQPNESSVAGSNSHRAGGGPLSLYLESSVRKQRVRSGGW